MRLRPYCCCLLLRCLLLLLLLRLLLLRRRHIARLGALHGTVGSTSAHRARSCRCAYTRTCSGHRCRCSGIALLLLRREGIRRAKLLRLHLSGLIERRRLSLRAHGSRHRRRGSHLPEGIHLIGIAIASAHLLTREAARRRLRIKAHVILTRECSHRVVAHAHSRVSIAAAHAGTIVPGIGHHGVAHLRSLIRVYVLRRHHAARAYILIEDSTRLHAIREWLLTLHHRWLALIPITLLHIGIYPIGESHLSVVRHISVRIKVWIHVWIRALRHTTSYSYNLQLQSLYFIERA